MKVVALKSFFGSGINAKSGRTLEVSDALANAWIKAGLVEKANASTSPAKATTSSTPAPSTPAKDETPETTGEVVATETEPTAPAIQDEPKAPTEPLEPTAPAPKNNNPNNSKKVNK